jgi:putative transposase
MISFIAFYLAEAITDKIKTAHMIRKGQLVEENLPSYKQFMALAG